MMLLSKKDIIELVKNNKFSMTYWKKLLALHEFVLPEQHKFEHQAIAIMVSQSQLEKKMILERK